VDFLWRHFRHRLESALMGLKNLIARLHQAWAILQRLRKPVGYILGGSILILLGARLYQSWRTLPNDWILAIDLRYFAASLVLLWVAYLLISLEWVLTLRAMNEHMAWRAGIKIWFLSLAMRYLPGSVWGYVGRAQLSLEQQIGTGAVVTSLVAEAALRVLSEVAVFALSLWLWTESTRLSAWASAAVGAGVIGAGGILTVIFDRRMQQYLACRGWFRTIRWPTISAGRIWGLLAYYALSVLAVGFAFYWFGQAIYPQPFRFMPVLTGILAIASTIGFLFPLAPQGLGVREGVIVALLSHQGVPSPYAILIGVGSRVWLILGEVLWIVVATRL
jgi:glycosyltransferase 2 family protein